MPKVEDKKPTLSPDGSHDDVELTDAERATSDQLLADAQNPDSHSGQGDGKESESTAKKAISAAAAATPWGKVASFFSKNKKGVVTGGTIAGTLIGVAIFIASLISGSTLVWMNDALQGVNFGPGDRNTVGQVRRVLANIDRIRSSGDTDLSRRATDIENIDRVKQTSSQQVVRHQRRFNYRSMVSSRIRGGFNWRFFTGRTPDVPGNRAGRRMLSTDVNSQKDVSNKRLGELGEDDLREIQESDNPRATSRNLVRTQVRGSLLAGGVAIACVAAVADDIVPSDQEIYEHLLGSSSRMMTAGSQMAEGEDVIGEEVADVMRELQYTEMAIEINGEDLENLTPAQREAVAKELEDLQNRVRDAQDGDEELSQDQLEAMSAELGVRLEENEQNRSWSNAAAWKRAMNEPLTGDEPDINISYTYVRDGLGVPAGAMLTAGSWINLATGGTAPAFCRFVSNPLIGWTLTAADGILSVKACIVSVGVGCGVRAAGFGVTEAIVRGISWMAMSLAFNSLAPEGPEDFIAHVDMGMNLGESEHARAHGAPPITSEQANERRSAHFKQLADEDRQQGLAWRYLSPNNYRSVFAQLAMSHQNPSLSSALGTIASIPRNLPRLFINALTQPVSAEIEFNNYDIQQYGFFDEDFEDPVQNAREVELSLRCANGTATSGDNCTGSVTAQGRIMQRVLDECIETSRAYWQLVNAAEAGDDFCFNPSSSERRAWVKVGQWKLNNTILASGDCLSHDDPCIDQSLAADPGSGGPPPDTVPSGNGWTIQDGADYSGVACADGSSNHSARYLTSSIYTHPVRGYRVRICRLEGTTIAVASIWSADVRRLLDAASNDGINLDGYGWRSYETQQEVYNRNCSGGTCNPPTARPGNSMHERGLAIDFSNCGTRGTACYQWLSSNSTNFNAHNLPSEPWHWSTNGH